MQTLRFPRLIALLAMGCSFAWAQPGFGPGFGGRGGGFGGMNRRTGILKQFDKDGDGRLNAAERKAARQYLATVPRRRGGGGRFRGGADSGPGQPGPELKPSEVRSYGNEPLYDLQTLRTFFLEFEDADWEQELADFYRTDVQVPAKLTVDGKTYAEVGVAFRGNTSYSTVSPGRKRSFDISLDYAEKGQSLGGYKSLNLLNSAADPTFMRTALYQYVARQYVAAPKANFVRVAINGESWGVYVNTQQINGDLTKEWFGSTKGARWKVPGSPRGRGGLAYYGDDPEVYKNFYEIKSKDDPKSWADLIHLCQVLNETPPDKLEKALEPLLDVDAALKWLALDKAAINNDGYWTRASDYTVYEDPNGRFHAIPWDANETFREPEQMFGGERGADLDPYDGARDPDKALLYRLLAVPALKARYLADLRDIAENWLDWSKIGPLVQQWQSLIAADVKTDTRKLFSTAAFTKAVTQDGFEPGSGPTAPPEMSLKSFVEQRRAYLLAWLAKNQPAR